MGSVIRRDELGRLAADLRRQGRSIVLTNGCYDLLHVGHLRCLQAARALGDVLLVGVNADGQVRLLKGADRPFVPDTERVELIAGLVPVDYAFIFPEPTASALIREIKPDVYAKGGDYRPDELPEARTIAACAVRLVILPLVPERSTTGLAALVAGRVGHQTEEG